MTKLHQRRNGSRRVGELGAGVPGLDLPGPAAKIVAGSHGSPRQRGPLAAQIAGGVEGRNGSPPGARAAVAGAGHAVERQPRLTLERAYEQLTARLEALTELVRAHLLRESLSERTLLTLSEAALLSGKRVATLRRYCREGRIKAERAPYGYGGGGWEYRIPRGELQHYLDYGLRPGAWFTGEPVVPAVAAGLRQRGPGRRPGWPAGGAARSEAAPYNDEAAVKGGRDDADGV